jgi:hypothetical protein
MGRPTLVRALLVALTMLVVLPASAVGAKPVAQFHDHFTESFSDEICGIPVDVDLMVTDNFFLYADGSTKDTSLFMGTFTNPLNGQSVRRTDQRTTADRGRGRGNDHLLDDLHGPAREDPDGTRARPLP